MPVKNSTKLVFTGSDIEIPLANSSKYSFSQTPGHMPNYFYFPVAAKYQEDLEDAIEWARTNPNDISNVRAKLVFTTCAPDDIEEEQTVEWEGIYIDSFQSDSTLPDEVIIVTAYDARELFRGVRVHGKFNMHYVSGQVDTESLNPAGTIPWTVSAYMAAIVNLFNTAIDHSAVPSVITFEGPLNMSAANIARLDEDIPLNLGNTITQSGGWIAGSWEELTEFIEKAFGFLPIMGLDGNVYITDLTHERADLEAFVSTEGMQGSHLFPIDNSASLPKELDLVFERKVEIASEVRPRSSPTPEHSLELVNVMRLPEDPTNPLDPKFEWTELFVWAAKSLWTDVAPAAFRNDPEKYIADNFFKEWVVSPYINQADKTVKTGAFRVDYINEEAENNWRSAFEVGNNNTGRQERFSRIDIGRLNEDGSTKDGGMVFCDFAIIRRRAYGRTIPAPSTAQRTIIGARFSDSFAISDWNMQPAPFTAFWTDKRRMILKVAPSGHNRVIAKGVVPGRLKVEMGFGNYIDMVADGTDEKGNVQAKFIRTKDESQLRDTFSLRVIMNGCPMRAADRHTVITKTLFADGILPKRTLKAYGVTANYRFSDAQMLFASLSAQKAEEWMNEAECDEIAERVAKEVIASYDKGYRGVLKTGNIDVVNSAQAGGKCNEMLIEVGGETRESITVTYSVKPGQITVNVGRNKLDGKPIEVAI